MIDNNTVAVILCAGKGSRMNSNCPKVLHKISGKPMLAYIMDAHRDAGIKKTIIVCSHENISLIQSSMVKYESVDFVIQEEQAGTADALKTAIKKTSFKNLSKIFLLLGDSPLINAIDIKNLSDMSDGCSLLIGTFKTKDPFGYGRVIKDTKLNVLEIVEEVEATNEQKMVNLCFSGIMVFASEKSLSLLEYIDNNNTKGEYYLTDVVKLSNDNNLNVRDHILDYDNVRGVNTTKQLIAVEIIMNKKIMKKFIDDGVNISLPDTSHIHPDTVFGRNVTIEPNVHIGEGVIIGNDVIIKSFSYIEGAKIENNVVIGPFARIRAATILSDNVRVGNFVEIKNSDISRGVKINHLSYIGDTSIGDNTNIGAGTITCNFDGVQKYKTKIGKDTFIGSNSSLIAPIKIDDNSYVASGSVINKNVPSDSLAISRAKQENKIGWARKIKKENN
jgi:bifunctional UDP-N-acetylglucosamine pyrophosphorylase/glucosamine-1-phosphate N-acetyltransferase